MPNPDTVTVPARHFEVRDGTRVISFKGELLASSSSRRPDSYRWVEFELYRTVGEAYVLSRIGVSSLFHDPGCAVVSKYNLKPGEPGTGAVPCPDCQPGQSGEDYVCVEKSRYWAQVSETPRGVIEALYKRDIDGTWYLTIVARKLIERASIKDVEIKSAYEVTYVA